MEIFFALGVLAVVVFLGWLARKTGVLSDEHTRGMSSYLYYFALPALFFSRIARTDLPSIDVDIAVGSLTPIFTLLAILALLRMTKILTKRTFTLFAISIVFGSNAFFGITFFEALAGEAGLDFAVISASILGSVGIALSIYLFEYATNRGEGWCLCGKIFRNPLILSILAGVLFSLLNLRLDPLIDGIALLGGTAAPLAIFALGTFIYENFSFAEIKKSIPFALFRLLALPAVSFLILNFWLRPVGDLREFLFLQSGIPAAISLAVFAKRYDFEVATISGLVVMTSLASFLVLGIAYFLIT